MVAAALNFSLNAAKLPNVLLMALGEFTGWLAAGVGSHDGPEHGVIGMAAAIVADGGADVFRNDGAVVGQQFFERLAGQVGRRF